MLNCSNRRKLNFSCGLRGSERAAQNFVVMPDNVGSGEVRGVEGAVGICNQDYIVTSAKSLPGGSIYAVFGLHSRNHQLLDTPKVVL